MPTLLAMALGALLAAVALFFPLRAVARGLFHDAHDVEGLAWPPRRPLLTMFSHPRQTLRWVLDCHPGLYVLPLAVLMGLIDLEPDAEMSLAAQAGLGAVGGIAGVFIGGLWMWLAGKAFGGRGTPSGARTALAWSWVVPIACALPLRLLFSWIDALPEEISIQQAALVGVALLLLAATLVWSLVVEAIAIAELHRFGAARTLGTILLMWSPALALYLLSLMG